MPHYGRVEDQTRGYEDARVGDGGNEVGCVGLVKEDVCEAVHGCCNGLLGCSGSEGVSDSKFPVGVSLANCCEDRVVG